MKKSSAYPWFVMVVMFLVLVPGWAYSTIWSMAINDIMADFGVSSATAQLGNSLQIAGYAIGSYVLAMLSAKTGKKKAASVGVILFLIGTFGIPFCHSFAVVLVLRFFQGCGIIWGMAVGLTQSWFPRRRLGLVSGIVGAGLVFGNGFGGWYASFLYGMFPAWRTMFLVSGIPFLVISLVFLIFVRDAPKGLYPEDEAEVEAMRRSSVVQEHKSVWVIPAAWLCCLALFAECYASSGWGAVFPQYAYGLGYSIDQVGMANFVLGLLAIPLTPVAGMLTDYCAKKGIHPLKSRAYIMAFVGFLPMAIACFLMPVLCPIALWGVYVIVIVRSTVSPIGNACLGALPRDLLGDETMADKMFGMTIFIGIMGGVITPYATAAIQMAVGWSAAFSSLAVVSLFGMAIGIAMPIVGRKQIEADREAGRYK